MGVFFEQPYHVGVKEACKSGYGENDEASEAGESESKDNSISET